MARTTKTKAIERLRKVLDEIPELKTLSSHLSNFPLPPMSPVAKELPSVSPEFKRWHRNAQVTLRNTFGDKSSQLNDFNQISYSPVSTGHFLPDSKWFRHAYVKALESAASLLESMIEEIKEYWEDEKQTTSSSTRGEKQQDRDRTMKSSGTPSNDQPSSNKVFVIHGRDDGAKETVARFLTKLGLEPVILHEQANLGRTIIEKFEYHADARFAVALLTPDDAGSLQGDKNNLKPRARQNVIFEFGYFIGKLDRKRVCALVKGNVEKPSDYDGVLYIPLDDFGGWEKKLIKELKSAGYDVDANRAL